MTKMESFDPVTFEVLRNAMCSILDEMALTVTQTAYSTLLKFSMDFSTSFCDTKGQMVAEGLSSPIQKHSLPYVIRTIMRKYSGSIYPGDIFITNDPYEGAAHLPDIFLAKPLFIGDELVEFPCAIGHMADMGGRVAGSNACDCTEIYQEGLRIPCVKLHERGVPNRTLLDVIEKNVRLPQKVFGDLRALVSACHIGEMRFLELVESYGWPTLKAYLDEFLDYSERMTREEISRMPEGVYEFTDWLDDDGFTTEPVKMHVKVTVHGDSMTVDFTETSPQVKAGINCSRSATEGLVMVAIKSVINPDIPQNSGSFRPITVIVPEGNLLNPVMPGPVAGRGLTCQRLLSLLYGAFAQFAPDIIPANCVGGEVGVSLGGYDREGKPFVLTEFQMGSWGGRPWTDGVDAHTPPSCNYSNTPVEVQEQECPVLIEQYGLVPDTGGPGKYRGGLALVRDYRFLADEGTLQLRTDRHRFRPYGLYGGRPGTLAANFLNPETENIALMRKLTMPIKKGDLLRTILAGAGGWGNPLERDVEKVLEDVRNEKLTIDYVRREYGVVIDEKTMQVDYEQTRQLREKMKLDSGSKKSEGRIK